MKSMKNAWNTPLPAPLLCVQGQLPQFFLRTQVYYKAGWSKKENPVLTAQRPSQDLAVS